MTPDANAGAGGGPARLPIESMLRAVRWCEKAGYDVSEGAVEELCRHVLALASEYDRLRRVAAAAREYMRSDGLEECRELLNALADLPAAKGETHG